MCTGSPQIDPEQHGLPWSSLPSLIHRMSWIIVCIHPVQPICGSRSSTAKYLESPYFDRWKHRVASIDLARNYFSSIDFRVERQSSIIFRQRDEFSPLFLEASILLLTVSPETRTLWKPLHLRACFTYIFSSLLRVD